MKTVWSSLQPILTRRVALPLGMSVIRSPYLRLLRDYKKEQWLTRQESQALQIQRLRKLLLHADSTTAYYHDLFQRIGFRPAEFRSLEQLEQVPPLTKQLIRDNFAALISGAVPQKSLHKYATGGSTGVPLTFYLTSDREIRQAATITLNYEWAGLELGDRLAMMWGAPFEETLYKSWKGKITNALLGRLYLPGFTLSDDHFADYVKRIQHFRPAVLLGYKSILVAFAKYVEQHPTTVPSLRSIMSGAETLYDHERAHLEEVFNVPVFNRYGGRDSGAVAAECPEAHSMHINSNILSVQTSTDRHLLVTDLWNMGMPFIRYDTEDMGELVHNECRCRRMMPVITRLEGRVHDLLVSPKGGYVPGEFFPHLFKDYTWIRQFQVIQEKLNHLTVHLVLAEGQKNQHDINQIRGHIEEYFGPITIDFAFVDTIQTLASGKHRFTVSHVKEGTQ